MRQQRKMAVHGTYAGAKWHIRHSVEECEPCREARREYQRRATANGRSRQRAARVAELLGVPSVGGGS